MATIGILVVPCSVFLGSMGVFLVWSYTLACCVSALLLAELYPWTSKKSYTLRLHKLAARLSCVSMMVVGRGLYEIYLDEAICPYGSTMLAATTF